MKNTIVAFCIIAVISLTACGGTSSEDQSTATDANSPAAISTTTDTSKSVWKDTSIAPGLTLPPANQFSTALNPEHGQPNHRCDIAVGAPLNSPRQQQPQQTAPSAQPLPPMGNPASVKLNPAHGQPGHDCAVPVGQPLKAS